MKEILVTYNFSLLFAYYDFWVGLFWDKKKRYLYLFLIPMFGFIIKFGEK